MAFGTVKYSLIFIIVLVSFFNGILSLLKLVAKTSPVPYIDEVFHIPQAQHYCRHEFDKWDNKITTLPGLYLVSLALLKPLEAALSLPSLCTVYGLRFVNGLGTVFNFLLIYCVQQKLSPLKDGKGGYVEVMSAVNLASFPPLFFFTFVYYTDVWSTAFVLLMYLFYLSHYPLLAAVAGAASVLMRQTNIIWVAMITLLTAWTALVGRKGQHVCTLKDVYREAIEALRGPFFWRLLQPISPYLIVGFIFVTFVVVNGGVVVGDRSSHVPVVHPMQNLYFIIIAAFFALPYIIFEVEGLVEYRGKFQLICTLWVGIAILSEYNLLEHPYLLADNRHLAFYIWKRTFGHRSVRRLLSPVYLLSGLLIWRLIRKENLILVISLAVCIVANLTPQYLFEIRYFIIPYIMLRLHFPQRKLSILLETLYFTAINAFVFYIFFNKQLYWPSEPRVVQRIIW